MFISNGALTVSDFQCQSEYFLSIFLHKAFFAGADCD